MIAETFAELILDLPHWGLEVVTEITFFALEVLILDRLFHLFHNGRLRRHRR